MSTTSRSPRRAQKADDAEEIFFELALADLRDATDLFKGVHERTAGVDGFCSLEVSPKLADDAAATIEQAAQLHGRAERDNLFIKIPGTPAGLAAIEETIFAGIPVNVTLLFSREHYLAAADAYMKGIERRIEAGLDPDVASVASIFMSRWDVAVSGEVPDELHNRLGLAIGFRAYRAYRELLDSQRAAAADERGRAPAAPALGEHRDQGPRRLRHPLHRGLRLALHRQHDARADPARLRRPRRGRRPRPGRRRRLPRRSWPSSATPGSTSTRSPSASRRRARRPSSSPGKT